LSARNRRHPPGPRRGPSRKHDVQVLQARRLCTIWSKTRDGGRLGVRRRRPGLGPGARGDRPAEQDGRAAPRCPRVVAVGPGLLERSSAGGRCFGRAVDAHERARSRLASAARAIPRTPSCYCGAGGGPGRSRSWRGRRGRAPIHDRGGLRPRGQLLHALEAAVLGRGSKPCPSRSCRARTTAGPRTAASFSASRIAAHVVARRFTAPRRRGSEFLEEEAWDGEASPLIDSFTPCGPEAARCASPMPERQPRQRRLGVLARLVQAPVGAGFPVEVGRRHGRPRFGGRSTLPRCRSTTLTIGAGPSRRRSKRPRTRRRPVSAQLALSPPIDHVPVTPRVRPRPPLAVAASPP